MRLDADVAVVGSGFGGSLLAMIARRLGLRVVLLERGRHPRFVIGESSTPLANLLLEELSRRYDLPRIAALSKWGSWQEHHRGVGCGLKRGFTFYHQRYDEPWGPDPGHRRQLLVAASPNDRVADTHWYRPDFDALLVEEACRLGAEYLDEVRLGGVSGAGGNWELPFVRGAGEGTVRARWVVDASGGRGFLWRAMELPPGGFPGYPGTQALYTHFSGVRRLEELGVVDGGEVPPYPVDDAAVHHVFPGGWIWVLRFNNGLTSAGVALRDEEAATFGISRGLEGWRALLARLPLVAGQFREATPTRDWVYQPRVAYRAGRVAGPGWALLPSSAGFVDPLLSTGFPLTLLGVERLGRLFESGLEGAEVVGRVAAYESVTLEELDRTAELIGALYRVMDDFELFAALTRLYFAAASFSETARRLGRPELAAGFLLGGRREFSAGLSACCRRVEAGEGRRGREALLELIRETVEPFDVAGLNRKDRRQWFPVDAADLRGAAGKVGASAGEIDAMLRRCGVTGFAER